MANCSLDRRWNYRGYTEYVIVHATYYITCPCLATIGSDVDKNTHDREFGRDLDWLGAASFCCSGVRTSGSNSRHSRAEHCCTHVRGPYQSSALQFWDTTSSGWVVATSGQKNGEERLSPMICCSSARSQGIKKAWDNRAAIQVWE